MVLNRTLVPLLILVSLSLSEEYLDVMEAMIKLEDYDIAILNKTDVGELRETNWEDKGFYSARIVDEIQKEVSKTDKNEVIIDGKEFHSTLPIMIFQNSINDNLEEEIKTEKDKEITLSDDENDIISKIQDTLDEIDRKYKWFS